MSQPVSGTPVMWRVGLGIAVTALIGITSLVAQREISLPLQSFLGMLALLGLAVCFSENIRAINWRVVITGLVVQYILAYLVIHNEYVRSLFESAGRVVTKFLDFSLEGARFVFGRVANRDAMDQLFKDTKFQGFEFFFIALPTVIFVSSFFTVLYHLRILQLIVWVFAKWMVLLMGKRGVSGAESLSATANVFMGQTEAPLIVKPYIVSMTKSELLALMIGGMATISGGMIVTYITFGADPVAILATSVMAAPTGLYLSKILIPETQNPVTRGDVRLADERPHANVVDAAASGASDGMQLVLNIAAMLIAFIAIIAMINYGLALIHPDLSLQYFFSQVFSPIALLMGVPSQDSYKVGEMLGTKLSINEFVAFLDLVKYKSELDPRSFVLTTYALTGFANFSSIGIQLGGIGALAPERRKDLAQLGMKALLGGFLATLINASIAGVVM